MTLRLARLWLVAIPAAAASLLAQTPPAGGVKPMPPPGVVPGQVGPARSDMVDSFKLSDGDIDAVLSALESFTGRTVVRPGQLPTATYTLKISRPIPKAELVTALETVLAMNGVAVAPMGDRFLKVTALAQAKSEAPEMISGSSLELPPSGRIVTKLFELNFLRVSEFVPQIQSFMTPGIGGGIVQLEKANVAMVTDSLENIQRIERLLDEVDKPRTNALVPHFYPLHNGAKASDVVTKIHTILSGPAGNQLRATTTYTADDRTNQVVVIADPKEYPLFDTLISQLDIVSDPATRNEVILLKHADAKDVSTLLSALISGQNAAVQKTSSQGGAAKPATPQPNPAPAVANVPAATEGAPGTTQFSSLVTIQPDERTNSVVVSGTIDDIKIIKSIVSKIDVLLAQVRIEVVIAEVVLSDSSKSGLSTLAAAIGKAPNGGTSITNLTATLSGLTIGQGTGGSSSTNNVNPVNVLATLSSLGDISTSKILQQNTITTTHNKEATITVTNQLPVITSSISEPTTSLTSGFTSSSTVTYKDIGITLKVTPLIGDDGSIQLKVDQTIDDQGTSVTINGNSQPSINHREATSFVNVMNDELVILGGFTSTAKSRDRGKLGILFEIPIISNFFGSRDNEFTRSELLLFLRPHVLKPDEGTADTHRAIQGMSDREQLNSFLANPTTLPDAKMSIKEKVQ
jgi:general secretion pathway protein D